MPEFRSIHELAVDFDVTDRVIRLRFHKLLAAGKLIEGRDCEKVNFLDDQHFEWRIALGPFERESGLRLAMGKARAHSGAPEGQPTDIRPTTTVTQPDIHALSKDNHTDTRPVSVDTRQGIQPTISVPQPDIRPAALSIEQRFIEMLQGQLAEKDSQISELLSQNKELNKLNTNLVGETVKVHQELNDTLRLSRPADETRISSIKVDEPVATSVARSDTPHDNAGHPKPTTTDNQGSHGGHVLGNAGSNPVDRDHHRGHPLAA